MLSIFNPATGKEITQVTTDSKETILKKFKEAKNAQQNWQLTPIADRLGMIENFKKLLLRNIEKLAAILTAEVGKPIQQSRNEINGAINRINWFILNSEKYLFPETMYEDDSICEMIRYEPLGVIANISAWNYPYLVGVNVFIPALIGGNAVLYKPSEFATLTGIEIARLMAESGIPESVFSIITGAKDAGESLLELPLDGYFFTGSYATGQYIYNRVAPKMVPCQCELGGKDPLYVADDIADIKAVAIGTADGAFYNNGQSCCAVERIYVHEKIYDEYVTHFINEVKSWKTGNPTEDGVYIGALTRPAQISLLTSQINEAIKKGATIATGGKAIAMNVNFFEPTVLLNVTNDMAVMQEESFGPIIGIMKVKNDLEAIEMMNDTQYGLTAAVYSNSEERAKAILAKVDAGTGYWNCCDRVSAALPWSGRKHSGFGSTLSHQGIRAFVQPKAYHLRKS